MKLLKFARVAALMCSANGVLAADSTGAFAIKGAGLSKCSTFVEAIKNKDQATLPRYIGWVEGFITAGNQHVEDTFDLTPWQNIRTLTQALANHCDRNADMRFGEAVVRMTAALQEERLTERSGLVAIEHEGKKHYVYEESVRRSQAKLSELGLYTGDIDGKFNDATKAALKTFQSEHELPETGVPDQKTMAVLTSKRKNPA